ncbi:MAG: hypothetical protein HGA39_09720 [Coriobacteriia bacterium]|nr:hypothetical protein [Coriobacteriia bacterium]
MDYAIGTRVRIRSDYHWACGALGVVIDQPGWPRTVVGRQGALRFFFVQFDVPQIDADGDGPYRAAEIDGNFLEEIG